MSYPLQERYPGTRALARVELCDLPTPLEPLGVRAMCGSLAVKRDDVTSPVYGGNKPRKLELLLGQALAEGRRAVITFGAYGSNHALATAAHARALGLEPHAVLSPQQPGPFAARTLRAHAGLGTVVHPVDGWDGVREAVRVKRELARRDGIEPCVIPMGGTNERGCAAYVNAALELTSCTVPDVIYVAAGTVGTAAGLALGLWAVGAPTRVEAVRVTPVEVCTLERARRVVADTAAFLRNLDASFPVPDFDELAFTLREEYFEPGYGVATPDVVEAVEAAREAGVRLETTYTGKAFRALLDDAASRALAGRSVVFWNTYSSAPLPLPGPDDALPPVLRDYVAVCDRLFGEESPRTGGGRA